MLEDGYHEVPAGHTASVVTYLEMHAPPGLRESPATDLTLARLTSPDPDRYRALFRAVGGDYLWYGRLTQSDAMLGEILNDPHVHLYIAQADGKDAGLLELDFRTEGACELAYFGLIEAHVGGGAGRWLMNEAISRAWALPIKRFFVHTCTLDHPKALAFYIRSGFTPYKRAIEIAPDPRQIGLLKAASAPQIPSL